jgi:malonate decarboxylase epsilon subunit
VPSHAPILKPVSTELQGLLPGLAERELTAVRLMITTARPALTMADVLDDLAMSVSQTVRWRDVSGVIAERGTRFVLQLPPDSGSGANRRNSSSVSPAGAPGAG